MDTKHLQLSAEMTHRLAQLRDQFASGLPARLAALESAAHAAWRPDGVNLAALSELRRLAYRLAGAAGSLGYATLDEAAVRLEQSAAACLEMPAEQRQACLASLPPGLAEVAAASGLSPENPPLPEVDVSALPLVLVVEDDPVLVRAIADRLDLHGYAVKVCDSPAEAGALEGRGGESAAIVLNTDTPPGVWPDLAAIPGLPRRSPAAPPLIFISERNDQEARLAAQRAGATRYLLKPLDLDRLMRIVDSACQRDAERPCKVLLVDDDADALAYHAALLQMAGMQVETVADPMQTHSVAMRLRPDCIVLERHMSACGGDGLAAMLRADARFLETPILFLCVAGSSGCRLGAFSDGIADAILEKPVDPADLAGSISVRVRRVRAQRRMSKELRTAMRENRFLRLALDLQAQVSVTDASGTIAYANDRFCQASGYRRSELLGQSHRLLKSGAHSDAFYADLWQTIGQGEVWRGEFCNRRKDGRLYWVDTAIVPFLDEAGRPTRYFSVGTDITLLKRTEQALQQAMQAQSELQANMSRALHPPLNVVLEFAEALDLDSALGPPQQEAVQAILDAGRRLLDIVNAMQEQPAAGQGGNHG